MWLYPLPCLVALAGWTFIFVTAEFRVILAGLASLLLGVAAFLIWSKRTQAWPFELPGNHGKQSGDGSPLCFFPPMPPKN
jgi:hypothetical protein